MTTELTEEELDEEEAWAKDYKIDGAFEDMLLLPRKTYLNVIAAARQSIEAKEFLIRAVDGDGDRPWPAEVRDWLDKNEPGWSNVVRVKP